MDNSRVGCGVFWTLPFLVAVWKGEMEKDRSPKRSWRHVDWVTLMDDSTHPPGTHVKRYGRLISTSALFPPKIHATHPTGHRIAEIESALAWPGPAHPSIYPSKRPACSGDSTAAPQPARRNQVGANQTNRPKRGQGGRWVRADTTLTIPRRVGARTSPSSIMSTTWTTTIPTACRCVFDAR